MLNIYLLLFFVLFFLSTLPPSPHLHNGNKFKETGMNGRGQPGPVWANGWKRESAFLQTLGCLHSASSRTSFFLVFLVIQGLGAAQSYLKSLNIISGSEMFPSFHWIQGAMWQTCRTEIRIRVVPLECEEALLLSRVTHLLKEVLVQIPTSGLCVLYSFAHLIKPCYSPER